MVSIFYIFGLAMQIVLVLYLIWFIRRAIKFVKKGRKWGRDYDALLWARAVIDPEGPVRIRHADIHKYRFNKKPKPVYTGKHPKLRKAAKRLIVINVILVVVALVVFNLSALQALFVPQVAETKTEITVLSVYNLVPTVGFGGQYFDLVGTELAVAIHPEDTAYMIVRIDRTDADSSKAREVVLTISSKTFEATNGTVYAYVSSVAFVTLNDTIIINETMTFSAMYSIGGDNQFLEIGILVLFNSFPNLTRNEYLVFQTTGAAPSSYVHVSGGPTTSLPGL